MLLSRIMSDVLGYRFIWLPTEYRSVTMATQHVSCTLAPLSNKYYTRNGSRLQMLGLDVLQLQQYSTPHYPVQNCRPLAACLTKCISPRSDSLLSTHLRPCLHCDLFPPVFSAICFLHCVLYVLSISSFLKCWNKSNT